jgi:two-component system sensor histidine kinase RegB
LGADPGDEVLETIRSLFAPPLSAETAQGTAKLAWVVRLRWVALVTQLGTIWPAHYFGLLERELLAPFLAVIAGLATLNVATWLWLRRGRDARQAHVLIALTTDAAALSMLLALTGGAWNPLAPILFVHAVLGSLLLEGRLSLYFFAVLIACLAFIQTFAHIPQGLDGKLVPSEILFPAQMLFAVVFWILTAWLSRTLTSLQSHFSALRDRKTRIDRLRAVGALAAGLSHEFATPLNTAQLKLRRLARVRELEGDSDLETASEALTRCGEVLRHMAGSQLHPDGISLDEVDIDWLVERVCTSVSQANENATIKYLATGRSPRRALVPAVAFSQAVLNLIDNALQAGGPMAPVEVIVSRHAGVVDVSVLDRGAGWPEVVRRHFGEPFVTTKPDGVGLGLYYVYTLAEALGAALVLEDRSIGGAIARITLPAVAATAGATAASDEEAIAPTAVRAGATP